MHFIALYSREWLGKWFNKYYYELTYPFGLASACQRWESVATALEWIIKCHLIIIFLIHYIDDYLLISNSLLLADVQLKGILRLCSLLGVPLSAKKLVHPCKRLIYLGIGIDVSNWTLFLDNDRLDFLRSTFLHFKIFFLKNPLKTQNLRMI